MAIARGTPKQPLVEPEDLFEAKIVDATPQAKELGVRVGMTGREAVETLLAASASKEQAGTKVEASKEDSAENRSAREGSQATSPAFRAPHS